MPQKRKRSHKKKLFDPSVSIPPEKGALSFSFQHIETDHDLFPLSRCTAEFFAALINKLQHYSKMSVDQFTEEDHRERRHTITWAETNVPEGFPKVDPNRVFADTAWQFSITDNPASGDKWRVHGFIVETTFYVVWLDAAHALTELQGGHHRSR